MNQQKEGGTRRSLAKRIATWVVVSGIGFFGIIHLSGIVHGIFFGDQWILCVAKEHFAAVVGLPNAALAAFFLVSVFEVTKGPIEFEGFGFKFAGASGPIIMWVICFLSISGSMKLLW